MIHVEGWLIKLGLSNISNDIIAQSRKEVAAIFQWYHRNFPNGANTELWLVGGWGVDAFNPWFGSRDIDILASSRVSKQIKNYLYMERGYTKYRNEVGLNRLCKQINSDVIELDFVPQAQRFECYHDKIVYLRDTSSTEHIQTKEMGDLLVPNKAILLGMKIKAAWDRTCKLNQESSAKNEYLEEKIIKDFGDIIALLDINITKPYTMDLNYLSKNIFSLSYLRKFMENVTEEELSEPGYRGKAGKECRSIIDNLLSIV